MNSSSNNSTLQVKKQVWRGLVSSKVTHIRVGDQNGVYQGMGVGILVKRYKLPVIR